MMLGNNISQELKLEQPNVNRGISLSHNVLPNQPQDQNAFDLSLESKNAQIHVTEAANNNVSVMKLNDSQNTIQIHCNDKCDEAKEFNNNGENSQKDEHTLVIFCKQTKPSMFISANNPKEASANGAKKNRQITVKVQEKDLDLVMLLSPLYCDCLKSNELSTQNVSRNSSHTQFYQRGQTNSEVLQKYALTEALIKQKFKNYTDRSSECQNAQCQFSFSMNGVQYSSPYSLQMSIAAENTESVGDYVEPGSVLQIKNIEIANAGQLPSPSQQKMFIGVQNSKQISFIKEDEVFIKESIAANKSLKINKPLKFQLKDFIEPSIDKPLKEDINVNFYGLIERVNKEIPQFATYSKTYSVGYPIILSQISGVTNIRQGEEAPIAFSIKNRSSQPIGLNTQNKRLLNIRLIQKGSSQIVEFIPKKNNSNRSTLSNNSREHNKLQHIALQPQNFVYPNSEDDVNTLLYNQFIDIIQPNESITISGTLKFLEKNTDNEQNIDLQVKLDLGYYQQQQTLLQNIQIQNFNLQLNKGYSYNQNSEFLVIYNKGISRELIESIRVFAKEIGKDIDLWDLSKDGAFSFESVISRNQKVHELYQGKQIIFLYALGSHEDQKELIKLQSFYKAAKFHSIRSYIIGQGMSNYSLFNPQIQNYPEFNTQMLSTLTELKRFFGEKADENRKTFLKVQDNSFQKDVVNVHLIESINNFTQPKEDIIEKKSQLFREKLELNNCNFFYIYYSPKISQVSKSLLSKEYDLGSIKIIEGLKKDEAEIIVREENVKQKSSLDENDKYLIFKILSFEKKLRILERMGSYIKAKTLIQAIFSDLASEYSSFLPIVSHKSKNLKLIQKLKIFQGFKFQTLSYSKQESDYELKTLMQRQKTVIFNKMNEPNKIGEYFINQLFNFRQVLIYEKSTTLSKYYLSEISKIIHDKLLLSNDQIKNKQSVLPQDKLIIQNLFQQLLNPVKEQRESNIQYSNQSSLSYLGKYSSVLHGAPNNKDAIDIRVTEDQLNFRNSLSNLVDENKRVHVIEKYEKFITFEEI